MSNGDYFFRVFKENLITYTMEIKNMSIKSLNIGIKGGINI